MEGFEMIKYLSSFPSQTKIKIQKMTLYDTSFKMLGQSKNKSSLELTRHLNPGLYFLEIAINDKLFFRKLIR